MSDSMTYNRDLWALISYFLDGLAIILTLTGVVLLAIYLASEVDYTLGALAMMTLLAGLMTILGRYCGRRTVQT